MPEATYVPPKQLRNTLTKSKSGYHAKTDYEVGPAENYASEQGIRVLRFSTWKTDRGEIVLNASVHVQAGNFESHGIFGDYSKTLHREKRMATQRAIEEIHAKHILQLPTVMAEVKAKYGIAEEVAVTA